MEKAIKKYFPIFVLPTLAAFIIGFLAPFVIGIWLSFNKFTTISDTTFVGFSNYLQAFQDSQFLYSLGFSTLLTICLLIIVNIAAFALATVLTKKLRGTNIFRTIFFMPNLIGGIVLGYIWQLIFNGIIESLWNSTLNTNQWYGFWGLVILVAWQQIGYMMIIYIAGIQTIPGDVLEAASIDGANSFQKLFRVTLPQMMPSITICTFLTLTNGFKLFDQNLALTNGEPNHLTEGLALNIYNTFYGRVGFEGVGQAKAVIFFILVAIIGMIQLFATKNKEVQQ